MQVLKSHHTIQRLVFMVLIVIVSEDKENKLVFYIGWRQH